MDDLIETKSLEPGDIPQAPEKESARKITINQEQNPKLFGHVELIRDVGAAKIEKVEQLFGGALIEEDNGSLSYNLTVEEEREVRADLAIKRMADRLERTARNSTQIVGEKTGSRAEGRMVSDVFVPTDGKPMPRDVRIDPYLMTPDQKVYVVFKKWIPGKGSHGGHPDTNPGSARVAKEYGGYVSVLGELEKFSDGSVGYERLTPGKDKTLLKEIVNAARTGREMPRIHSLGVIKDERGNPEASFVKPDPLSMKPILAELVQSTSEEKLEHAFADYIKNV